MTATAALALTGISVRLGRRDILDDVSLTVSAGQITAIIGPNGAGKSTLLAVAAGQLTPAAGSVCLGEDDLHRLPVREAARRRAVMPQDSTVAFGFTVREVVALGRSAWRRSGADDARVVDDALARVGLTAFAEREVPTLSGGERQLTALARVIAQATPVGAESVILLDEPTSAMDVAHAEATLTLMRELAADGAGIVIVLHDLDAAAAYADRLVLMQHGGVRAVGSVAEVCTPELLSEVYGTPIDVFRHADRLRVTPLRSAIAVR